MHVSFSNEDIGKPATHSASVLCVGSDRFDNNRSDNNSNKSGNTMAINRCNPLTMHN